MLVSLIYKTSQFSHDHEIVKRYFNADLVSVTEVLGSPLKWQLSLKAQVIKVFDAVSGSTWQRRDVMMSDALRSVKSSSGTTTFQK